MDTIIMLIVAAFCGLQWYQWRKAAIHWRTLVESVENNTQPAKDMMNALEDERRLHHSAMMESFEWINENGDRENTGLMQVKNILLHAIQNSTYGRG